MFVPPTAAVAGRSGKKEQDCHIQPISSSSGGFVNLLCAASQAVAKIIVMYICRVCSVQVVTQRNNIMSGRGAAFCGMPGKRCLHINSTQSV